MRSIIHASIMILLTMAFVAPTLATATNDTNATTAPADDDALFATDTSTNTPADQVGADGEPAPLPIPTLSQWAAGALILLLGTVAVAWLSLRKDLELPEVGRGDLD